MREQSMWVTVRPHLRGMDPVRVDNPAEPGTPDVNFVGGWVELKSIPEWPVRPLTPLRIPHFTKQQRVWLLRRRHAGGVAFLLLKVRNEWLLFDGAIAARHVGESTRQELYDRALAVWPNGLNGMELRKWLKGSD